MTTEPPSGPRLSYQLLAEMRESQRLAALLDELGPAWWHAEGCAAHLNFEHPCTCDRPNRPGNIR